MRTALLTAALLVGSAATASATEITLTNHKFVPMGESMVSVPGKFVVKEGIGETFSPPANYYPFRVVGAQFLAVSATGASSGSAKLTFEVYKDTGGTKPGQLLLSHIQKDPAEGNTMFVQTEEFSSTPTVDSGPVRLAIFTDTNSDPDGITFTADPLTSSGAHSWLCAQLVAGQPCSWIAAKDAGVKYGWIVGLTIDTQADVPVPDMGNGGGDGGVNPGGAPQVDSVFPDSFPEGQGGAALVQGRNFAIGKTMVVLDGKKGPVPLSGVLVENGGSIKIQVPEGLPAGAYTIVVQTNVGTGKLNNGLIITEAQKSGCSASGHGAPGAFWLAGLLLVPLLRRRRQRGCGGA